MKTSQIIYLIVFIGVVVWMATQTPIFDRVRRPEGFENPNERSEPVVPMGLPQVKLETSPGANPSEPGQLPFGPYAQMASVGSYQYQDPSLMPAVLQQMKQLREDIRGFLVFEGAQVASSSDPTVQLPLTQIRADSRKLDQEISVLENNQGIQSQLTQQDVADMQGALTFLQKKVRLFQTSGVINKEGFEDMSTGVIKTKATRVDLQVLQSKIYGSILSLSASGTTDPVVQARIKALQEMYSTISDMLNKLDQGIWSDLDIPVFKEDIENILPKLASPNESIGELFNQSSGKPMSPATQALASVVGEQNADAVFKNLQENGMFRLNLDIGYNVPGTGKRMEAKQGYTVGPDGKLKKEELKTSMKDTKETATAIATADGRMTEKPDEILQVVDTAYDAEMPGYMDRFSQGAVGVAGNLDWKLRTEQICEQIRMRGLNPVDFGCIPRGSVMSPAYSWRGHAKMVCGRLAATTDPGLPETCGCPPQGWKGWTV
jgi:hypothetical protein